MAKLTVEVDEDLRGRIEVAAMNRDETVEEFLKRAMLRELENGEEIEFYPSEGGKPRGSENPIKPKGGGNPVSDAVIEDRR